MTLLGEALVMAVLESIVPLEVGYSFMMNAARLTRNDVLREETRLHFETRAGSRMGGPTTRDPTPRRPTGHGQLDTHGTLA